MKDIKIEVDGVVLSHIYSGKTIAEAAEKFAHFKDVYIVYDRNARNHAEAIATVLNATGKVNVHGLLPIIATEELKTIETALSIDQWLLKENVDRDALLLAVGGGITTDIAGFAASIYKRGIRFAYIPTTLLSQVDAAIGGKTGVNFHWYKNMLGVIRQPEFTYVCPEVLETLPRRDFVSGAAELLKTFIIKDDGYYFKEQASDPKILN